MIRHIKGEYLYYDRGAVIVETRGGIGFRIHVADTSPLLYAREGDILSIDTYLQVKDDGMALYGFSDRESLELFEMLLTVNSVGPKAALAIMSTASIEQIKQSIVQKDAAAIAKAQGVGKKTAERVILELCDKISAVPVSSGEDDFAAAGGQEAARSERSEALIALTTLGYSKMEAEEALSHVTETDLTAEEYIRKSLKYLL